ncbi:hypothetical protein AB0M50_54445 [Nonomuraea fuscirosea]|uniref:hypothetical protein n=1 Tax=Nonomuraea fuscirosea TaxID=1291556 RepID=UPI0034184E35
MGKEAENDAPAGDPPEHAVDHRDQELRGQVVGVVQTAQVDLDGDQWRTLRHPQPGRAEFGLRPQVVTIKGLFGPL